MVQRDIVVVYNNEWSWFPKVPPIDEIFMIGGLEANSLFNIQWSCAFFFFKYIGVDELYMIIHKQ